MDKIKFILYFAFLNYIPKMNYGKLISLRGKKYA